MAERATTVPITGAVLRWAREYRNLSIHQAAQAAGINEADLQALEAESIEPTLGLLSKLSGVYKQPESVLLLPTPPATRGLPTDYRTIGGARVRLSPETIDAIHAAQDVQDFLAELLEEDEDILPRAEICLETTQSNVGTVAERERGRMGVTTETQLLWRLSESFERWRLQVEALGILVLVKKMPREDCRGFSLAIDGLVPTIVVNGNDLPAAQTFTLFHEYGHLMLGNAGVCLRLQQGSVEPWCNRFAAALLVPEVELHEHVAKQFPGAGTGYAWSADEIRRLANRYKVSRPAMAIRLQELKLAPPDYYDVNFVFLNHTEQKPIPAKPPKGIRRTPRDRQRFQEIGFHASSAIVGALREQLVDATEAASVLGLNLRELFRLEDHVQAAQFRHTRP